jgi:hypothetical protein
MAGCGDAAGLVIFGVLVDVERRQGKDVRGQNSDFRIQIGLSEI